MDLTPRQLHIVEIVKRSGPITAEDLAAKISVSRATIRADLSLLSMAGYLDAKPRVGYTYAGNESRMHSFDKLKRIRVKDVQSVPAVIREDASLYDAVVATFLEDTGTLFVVGPSGSLVGAVTRSDLLRSAIGQVPLDKVPVGVIMTRSANLITVSPEDSVLSAVRKLWMHKLYALPVTRKLEAEEGCEVTGSVNLSIITGLVAELLEAH